jgi:uncharacterized protein (UPF0335 family)
MSYIDTTADILNVSDLTDRVDELEAEREALRAEFDDMPENNGVDFDAWVCNQTTFSREDQDELDELVALLDDLCGNGGDHQWRGEWYPSHLIRDSHFVDYTIDMLRDCGTIPDEMPTWIVVDWDATADNVRMDYSAIDIGDVTYWYR